MPSERIFHRSALYQSRDFIEDPTEVTVPGGDKINRQHHYWFPVHLLVM